MERFGIGCSSVYVWVCVALTFSVRCPLYAESLLCCYISCYSLLNSSCMNEKKFVSTHDVISLYVYALHTPKAPVLLQDQRDSPCGL
jgi:hypothetical protein